MVGAIAQQVIAQGVPAKNIYIYERFMNQLRTVGYEKHVPEGVNVVAAENNRGSIVGYDPQTYVECDFFGEEDTRSNLTRLVSETLTKIINVPNMKEHRAAGEAHQQERARLHRERTEGRSGIKEVLDRDLQTGGVRRAQQPSDDQRDQQADDGEQDAGIDCCMSARC